MGTPLARLIHDLDQLDDDLTIYAQGGPNAGPDAPAVAVPERDDGTVPREAAGLDYFLEVDIAKEVVAVWSEWRGGRVPTATFGHVAVRACHPWERAGVGICVGDRLGGQ